MEEDNQHLLQFLIPSTTTTIKAAATDISSTSFTSIATGSPIQSNEVTKVHSPNFGIISRLVLIIFIGTVSIWANHEASKGFSISIVNEAPDTFPGKLFDLFYVSNDEASRVVLTASKFVENFLYPNGSYPKKQVSQVILRLSYRNLSSSVIVDSGQDHDHRFVLHISPSVLEEINFSHAMFVAVQHGMARTWLWDGQRNAPSSLVNAIVEYISKLAVSGGLPNFGSFDLETMEIDSHCSWKSKNPVAMAQFLNYCELKRPGFIRRLNQALKNGWHDRMVDDALGMSMHHLCNTYYSSSHYASSI